MLQVAPAVNWKGQERPKVSPKAFVHQTAVLIGDVVVEDNVIIFPYAVLRADEGFPIVIGENSNIQDGVIMHCLKEGGVQIGKGCTVAHGAIIHGPCEIGEECFIGFRSVIFKVVTGGECFISHGAIVTGVEIAGGKFIPDASVIDDQVKAEGLETVTDGQKAFMQEVLAVNRELLYGYQELSKT